MDNKIIAESFPPGEFIKDELEARGWTQSALANIMGRQNSVVSALIKGKRAISREIAEELGSAFGTSADVWMNLQASYDLYERGEQKEDVSRRAKLFAMAPINDMIRRGWIRASDDLDTLEQEVTEFLNEPISAVSFYKSNPNDEMTPSQRAWLCQARKIARGVQAAKFSQSLFARALQTLKKLLVNPEDVTHVARVLAEGGVRFLIIESLPHTKIDGACFWLDEFSPVIVMTMRYDRIDNFWYVLTHECGHVKNEHGIDGSDILDINLVGDERVPFKEKPANEKVADEFAEDFLIDQSAMNDFVNRKRPAFSKQLIRGFAMKMRVHPGIVLGQLQFREEVGYFHSREMLVKIRDLVTRTALTDGWGHTISMNS
jgi:HTH-type transcriptional regulator/antitoxin HigA